jgi:two-component system CheB/CheR fusion protein
MAREGLKYKLNTALQNAVKQKKTIVSEGLKVKHNKSFRAVDLIVRPLIESGYTQGFMLVMFEDKTLPEPVAPKKAAKKDIVDPYVLRLEKELLSCCPPRNISNPPMKNWRPPMKSSNPPMRNCSRLMRNCKVPMKNWKLPKKSCNRPMRNW